MSEPNTERDKVPEQPGTGGEPAPERTTEEQLAEARARIEEQREAWLRALADAENARKRAQLEIAQARKYGTERLVEELLPALDSLEAALEAKDQALDSLREGVTLTLKQLRAALEKTGVAEIGPEPGHRFDPHRHQAMAAAESDQEPNTVLMRLQKGYALHDRVVRPALVTVAKARTVEKPAGNPISDSNLESN
ncbi:MAG: nucleotide exchange factor GrpE [Burkholderiales bacterium]